MTNSISINCDMGESDSLEGCRNDLLLMPWISQCNIAVGGHVGNAETIACSFRNAADHDLKIGLHPSYPDRVYFGRSRQDLVNSEVITSLKRQIDGALEIAQFNGISIRHIKFHGQLYNDLEIDSDLREAVLELVKAYPALALMGHSGGELMLAAAEHNIVFIREAFADRTYVAASRLQSRSEDGSLITDANRAAAQALDIAHHERLTLFDGSNVRVAADSLCVHADTPNSLQILRAIQDILAKQQIAIV